jgi:hypothetical protein
VTALRLARLADLAAIEALITRSAQDLSAGYYSPAQVAALLRHVFGADTQLVRDGTYFVCETDGGALVAAGGWSRRATLYGADRVKGADDPLLDPATEPARRAFFVDPAGVVVATLLGECLGAARAAGFRSWRCCHRRRAAYRAPALSSRAFFARLPDGIEVRSR